MAYLFGNRWCYQTAYKVLSLIMLFIGGLQQYTVVWDLGDVGIGLMTLFNIAVLYPMSKEALELLRQYEEKRKTVIREKEVYTVPFSVFIEMTLSAILTVWSPGPNNILLLSAQANMAYVAICVL